MISIKRVISLLCICALITQFSSCGLIVINYPQNKDGGETTGAVTDAETETQPPYTVIEKDTSSKAKKYLDSIESVNYNGAVVKIASVTPILTDDEEAPLILSEAVETRNKLVEDKFGISIVTVSTDLAELFAELSASSKIRNVLYRYYADTAERNRVIFCVGASFQSQVYAENGRNRRVF